MLHIEVIRREELNAAAILHKLNWAEVNYASSRTEFLIKFKHEKQHFLSV
jgi:hypothetical protein